MLNKVTVELSKKQNCEPIEKEETIQSIESQSIVTLPKEALASSILAEPQADVRINEMLAGEIFEDDFEAVIKTATQRNGHAFEESSDSRTVRRC